jgi:hypothetical protein
MVVVLLHGGGVLGSASVFPVTYDILSRREHERNTITVSKSDGETGKRFVILMAQRIASMVSLEPSGA